MSEDGRTAVAILIGVILLFAVNNACNANVPDCPDQSWYRSGSSCAP